MNTQDLMIQHECTHDVAASEAGRGISALGKARENAWFAKQDAELLAALRRTKESRRRPVAGG